MIIELFLSFGGWLVSLYFILVYRRRIPHKIWWIPPPIRISGPVCTDIVDSRFGRILKQPNAYWGLWYYGLLSIILAGAWFFSFPLNNIVIVITGITLIFSLYLLYGLYELKVVCRPCLTIHTINISLFIFMFMRFI